MKVIWKDIEGFNGVYKINNFGQIFSKISNRTLIGFVNTSGYRQVRLTDGIKHRVSRLVAKHFVANECNSPLVNHINGNKLDDRASNLEWCSYSENNLHAYRTGLKMPSSRGHKLDREAALEIRRRYSPRLRNMPKLAREYNISVALVSEIINRKKWARA